MAGAKYYIYRNLKTKGFSVRYKGRVIEHIISAVATGVTFVVNRAGRQKAIRTKQRNVHAFVACSKYTPVHSVNVSDLCVVSYNPFKADYFESNGTMVYEATQVVLHAGKCYILE